MNLLDENTAEMLDDGGMVLLDGKYLAMTPETLNQAVKDGLMMAIGDAAPEHAADERANDSSMCATCGTEDTEGTHELVLAAGYGSVHDMERVRVPLCAECCDRLFSELVQLPGTVIESPW